MKPVSVYMERTFNLGNYQSFKVGITVEIEKGETATEVAETSRKFIAQQYNRELEKLKEKNK